MTSDPLRDNVTWDILIIMACVFAGVLRKEAARRLAAVYARVKAGLDLFEMQRGRMDQRMKPEGN